MLILLAQSGQEAQAWGGLLWIAVIVVLASIGAVLVGRLTKRWRISLHDTAPTFTLDQLRKMRDQGELTTPEYDALRKKIVKNSML